MFDHVQNPVNAGRDRFAASVSVRHLFFGLLSRSRLALAVQVCDFAIIATIAILMIK